MEKIHAVCPSCLSVNAIVPGKPDPKCGKCSEQLLPQHPIRLTDASFDRFISKSAVPVLVDFWAPWCGPCKMMGPAFDQAAASLHMQCVLAKIDSEAQTGVSGRLRIQSVPTIILFMNGQEIARTAGAMPTHQIVTWALQNIGRS